MLRKPCCKLHACALGSCKLYSSRGPALRKLLLRLLCRQLHLAYLASVARCCCQQLLAQRRSLSLNAMSPFSLRTGCADLATPQTQHVARAFCHRRKWQGVCEAVAQFTLPRSILHLARMTSVTQQLHSRHAWRIADSACAPGMSPGVPQACLVHGRFSKRNPQVAVRYRLPLQSRCACALSRHPSALGACSLFCQLALGRLRPGNLLVDLVLLAVLHERFSLSFCV